MCFLVIGLLAGGPGTGLELVPSAEAAGGKVVNPTGTAPDRYIYFPGTEEIGQNEIFKLLCRFAAA